MHSSVRPYPIVPCKAMEGHTVHTREGTLDSSASKSCSLQTMILVPCGRNIVLDSCCCLQLDLEGYGGRLLVHSVVGYLAVCATPIAQMLLM